MSKAALAGNAKEKVVEFGPLQRVGAGISFGCDLTHLERAVGLSRLQVLLPESEQLTAPTSTGSSLRAASMLSSGSASPSQVRGARATADHSP